MAPPPTPTSLMDLPGPWLLKLATRGQGLICPDRPTPLSLFRTCTFFRDVVLQHRAAEADFHLPLAEQDLPAAVRKLCGVARRSSNVKLSFCGDMGEEWTHYEPQITHLLVCAMAELGGPLTCVKAVHTECVHHRAIVPAWLKVCCPDVTCFTTTGCSLTAHVLDVPPPPPARQTAAPGAPTPRSSGTSGKAPLTCRSLQDFTMSVAMDRGGDAGDEQRQQQHIRQELAALPNLTYLQSCHSGWMLVEPARAMATVTSLSASHDGAPCSAAHLAAQFPNLRELQAWDTDVDDAGLEALLRLPHLERLTVAGFSLRRSHARRAWAGRCLTVKELDVKSFARLPLEGIPGCSFTGRVMVVPSRDARAVARVAEAVGRWGRMRTAMWDRGLVEVDGADVAALLATLGPLLAALPAAQCKGLHIRSMRDVVATVLPALFHQLPGSVQELGLHGWGALHPAAWPALLPSLPATVATLRVEQGLDAEEEELVALCVGAVRRIKVRDWRINQFIAGHVEQRLAKMGKEQLVTFETW